MSDRPPFPSEIKKDGVPGRTSGVRRDTRGNSVEEAAGGLDRTRTCGSTPRHTSRASARVLGEFPPLVGAMVQARRGAGAKGRVPCGGEVPCTQARPDYFCTERTAPRPTPNATPPARGRKQCSGDKTAPPRVITRSPRHVRKRQRPWCRGQAATAPAPGNMKGQARSRALRARLTAVVSAMMMQSLRRYGGRH